MHVLHVVGARPNFMKVAPVITAFDATSGVRQTLVHTGQHYDPALSDIFFEQLEIRRPEISLEVGSGSHAVQTAEIMMRFEQSVVAQNPDVVLVYGDVNSTVSAALVCAKLGIQVAHVEAGLRSFDRTMPEEINRLVTDQLSNLLLTSSPEAEDNLKNEGIPQEKIHFVGNVMIDTLHRLLPKAQMPIVDVEAGQYVLVTIHRPSNVDDPVVLSDILQTLDRIAEGLDVVFPVHPRTQNRIDALPNNPLTNKRVHMLPPTGYLESLALQKNARLVITDSGGIQEETTALGIPCLTVRKNTERPVTVSHGSNKLVGQDMKLLEKEFHRILETSSARHRIPPLWDGHAAERIADIILSQDPADS